jgi:hypothetical protein
MFACGTVAGGWAERAWLHHPYEIFINFLKGKAFLKLSFRWSRDELC